MNSIIETVSYSASEARQFRDKLADHLGIHALTVVLEDGEKLEGVLSEVGLDYISLVADDHDLVIPIPSIRYFRYAR